SATRAGRSSGSGCRADAAPSERPAVQRARAANLVRIVALEAGTKVTIPRAVPDRAHAVARHIAEVQTVRRADHAARHRDALPAHVDAASRPIAARRALRLQIRQAQIDADARSEERRVGKEGSCLRSRYQEQRNSSTGVRKLSSHTS